MTLDVILIVAVVFFSAIIHEAMHGYMADLLGDPTARLAGRLTLNPLKHIDPFGSIVLPFLSYLAAGISFGYAKPVPYNPYNLRPGRFSEALVAGAGPFSNAIIALLAGLALRFGGWSANIVDVLFTLLYINVLLCVFNLIPVPPLDGSKVLESLLPHALQHRYAALRRSMEMNPLVGMLAVFLLIYVLGGPFRSLIFSIAYAVAGLNGTM